ncbi:Clavaminate synthase-like protein [Xylariaceae sp. FL0804]|nr:Clavaminate synthase-like protein [Xylariaceae sp. FL0804]
MMAAATAATGTPAAPTPTATAPAVAAAADEIEEEVGMDLPLVDLDVFRLQPPGGSAAARDECARAARALITHGALVLHDSRVSEDDNTAFLDLLEDYFAQPAEVLKRDERPDLGYQVGVTLENTERPSCASHAPCLDVIERLAPEERPLDITAAAPDPKCRFFWRMAEPAPYATAFPALNADNVVPQTDGIRERWTPVMEKWGSSMKAAVSGLAEMAAVGLGLPAETFSDAGRYGPHLLAPTASDLSKYGAPGTILAGFHTDLNFLTIHGRSRYPGLHVWARNTGRRIPVRIPSSSFGGGGPGQDNNKNRPLLLVQAGKQLEHLTGGLVRAGYHEVVVTEATRAAVAKYQQQQKMEKKEGREGGKGERPCVRVSSTFFWHLGSDVDLAPIPALARRAADVRARQRSLGRDEGDEVAYEPMKVGEQVQRELKNIALMA